MDHQSKANMPRRLTSATADSEVSDQISRDLGRVWETFPMSSVCILSRFSLVQLFAIPWTVAHQAPLFMGFPRQRYWSGLPLPPSVWGQPAWPLLTSYVCVHAQWCGRVQLFAAPRTAARQAPLSVRFSRQEDWSGLLFPPPGDLPQPGIEPVSPECSALAGGFFTTVPPPRPHL